MNDGVKLLDLGCGTGSPTGFFKSLGFDVYGVDFSGQEIDVAMLKILTLQTISPSGEGAIPAELGYHFINFTRDAGHLKRKFSMFEPIFVGYYDHDVGEGSTKH